MKKSIVLMPNWLGDLMLSLAVVSRKAEESNEKCTLLIPEQYTQIANLLTTQEIIPFPYKNPSQLRLCLGIIKEKRFDCFYLIPFSFSSAWFAFKTRIPQRRGLAKEGRSILLSDSLAGSLRDKRKHIIVEYAEILNTPFMFPHEWEGYSCKSNEKYKNTIAFCPGALYGPAKRWLGFKPLRALLNHEKVIILGSLEDREYGNEIIAQFPENSINLAGQTTLVEVAEIIAGIKCLVSNDSGLMHLAGYLGTPVVGVFGSTNPIWTRPVGKKSLVVQSHEICAPCYKRNCKYNHYHCLTKISAEQVYGEIMQVIS